MSVVKVVTLRVVPRLATADALDPPTPAPDFWFCTLVDVSVMYRHVVLYFQQLPSSPYDRELSMLEIEPRLLSLLKDACALVPFISGLLLRADRLAASICFLVCWCMVRVYEGRSSGDDEESSPFMSGEGDVGV